MVFLPRVCSVVTSAGYPSSVTMSHMYIILILHWQAPPGGCHHTPSYPLSSDHATDLCALALSSSRFAARSFACSCLIAAFTFLCRFLRPFPRLGPSTTTGSVVRCFRFASCSARCFSRFLSRLRSVVKDALRRPPYAAWNFGRSEGET